MGRSQAQEPDDAAFLELFALLVTDLKAQSNGATFHKALDPERVFVISEDNKKRIKELLVNLQREKLLEDEKSNGGAAMDDTVHASSESALIKNSGSARVLETFTNLLFEALQFVQIIPSVMVQDMRSEMEELKKVAEAFNTIKNNLIDFKNIVA